MTRQSDSLLLQCRTKQSRIESARSFAVFVAVLLIASAGGCSSQENSAPPTVAAAADPADELPAADAKPVAVLDETEAFLGILDPVEEVEHLFTIRNEGEAPLELRRGGTSCKCTMSALPDKPIMPGQAAVVRVSTKSEEKEGEFSHTATVLTNDPNNHRIEFRVYGKFQTIVAFDPPSLILSSMKRGQAATVETVVYSQFYREFELESIESSLDGLAWEVDRADEPTLDALKARCGYRLRLTLPAAIATGDFRESLTVKTCSDDDPPRINEASCRIVGSVAPLADIRGRKLGAQRILNVGSLARWQGATERLTLTVHDDHRSLRIKSIEKEPDFLEVEVLPMVPEKPDSGLYWVVVTIPRDAPASNHIGGRKGEVRIVTDHPELPVMSFWVQFAIASG